ARSVPPAQRCPAEASHGESGSAASLVWSPAGSVPGSVLSPSHSQRLRVPRCSAEGSANAAVESFCPPGQLRSAACPTLRVSTSMILPKPVLRISIVRQGSGSLTRLVPAWENADGHRHRQCRDQEFHRRV